MGDELSEIFGSSAESASEGLCESVSEMSSLDSNSGGGGTPTGKGKRRSKGPSEVSDGDLDDIPPK